jgi:hypothetical protein
VIKQIKDLFLKKDFDAISLELRKANEEIRILREQRNHVIDDINSDYYEREFYKKHDLDLKIVKAKEEIK